MIFYQCSSETFICCDNIGAKIWNLSSVGLICSCFTIQAAQRSAGFQKVLLFDQNPNTSPGKPMNPYNESQIEPSTVDFPKRPDFIIFDLWFIGIHSHNMSQLIASYLLLEICFKYVHENHAMLLANVMYTVVFLPRTWLPQQQEQTTKQQRIWRSFKDLTWWD